MGGTVKGSVLKPAAEKAPPAASQRGIKKGIAPKVEALSDLSIERIYLKNCTIYVRITNHGKGGLSEEDYLRGKLVIEIEEIKEKGTFSTSPQKTRKYTFALKDVDPNGVLKKAGGTVDFDTKIGNTERQRVRAHIEGLKADGKKGRKSLAGVLLPSSLCKSLKKATRTASTSSTPAVASAASSRRGNVRDNRLTSGSGAPRQRPSEQDLERARALEMAEKMERIKTLERVKGQRAFEAERESRGLWEEHEFGLSGDRRTNPKGGPIRGEGLFGPETPKFENYRDLMGYMTGGSTMRGLPGTPGEPRYGPKFSGGGWHPKPVAEWIRSIVAPTLGYNYPSTGDYRGAGYCLSRYRKTHDLMWIAFAYAELALAFAQSGNEEWARDCVEGALKYIAEDGDLLYFDYGDVLDYLDPEYLEQNREDFTDRDDPYVDPEKLFGERKLPLPWAPHRHPVKHREEATDIERTPHAMDVYHYDYEKRKKKDERAGGPQVNPGSTSDAREIRHYNQGAETIWRLKTWATDPDFPSATEEQMERMNEQNVH